VLRLEILLPARLHIAGLRVAHAVRLRWWRVARRRVRGVRVLVIDGTGRILLIRHSYGSGQWMLPGGGLGAGEDVLAGAARELVEETSVRLSDPILLGRTDAPDSVHETWLAAGWSDDHPVPDGREIIAAGWFAPSELPQPIGARFAEHLGLWVTAAQAARRED
jgi:ADP-ribose pyrophosphatase YjhB (NUDIX family)